LSQKPTYEELEQRIKELEKRDFTGKKTEEAFRESEKRYRLLADNVTDLIWTMDMEMNYTYFSPSVTRMSGYSVEEAMAKSVEDTLTPESLDIVMKAITEELEMHNKGQRPQDRSRKEEVELIGPDGSTMWAEIKGKIIFDADGQPQSIIGVTRDITERKRAEKELIKYRDHLEDLVRERTAELAQSNKRLQDDIVERKRVEKSLKKSEEKYRSILDSISDGYTETDFSGRYVYMNKEAYEFMGYTKEEYLGRHYKKTMTPETAKKVFEVYSGVYKTGKPATMFTYDIIKKDGSIKSIETNVSLKRDDSGNPNGLAALSWDITGRKKQEAEKKKLEAQLQQAQKMESIGTLAGGIAHDFNNLLMGILGNTSLLFVDLDQSHPYYENLSEIEGYAKSAANLTRQLLGFARGGKYEVKTTNLNELIKTHNKMFGRTKKEITIKEKYEKKLWAVEVDQVQIEQVLMNLYVNAWHAMLDGGQIYVQTENVKLDKKYKQPFQVNPGRYVKISVTDTGTGMDEKTQLKIFDPFFTTKEKEKGTGMGLSSVYGIIKNHSGFVIVNSSLGEGATFDIYLPASKKKIEKAKKTKEVLLKGTGTILLIDDEPKILNINEKVMNIAGYKVLTAIGGEKGVEKYKNNQDTIDIVILDMIMPEISGSQTYDRLKEINPDVKVLLSTGYSLDGKAKDILNKGCDGFIQKPFDMKQLSKKLSDILNK
jgi:two-component system cell cycle sensor histidine kinase/response regulator CckA